MNDTQSEAAEPSDDHSSEQDETARDPREYLLKGALLVLGLLAIVALFQFYTSVTAVINEWVARQYRPIFRAAFNLVVLFATGIGISLVVRELSAS